MGMGQVCPRHARLHPHVHHAHRSQHVLILHAHPARACPHCMRRHPRKIIKMTGKNKVTVQMHDSKQYFTFEHALQSFVPLSA